MVRRVPDPDFLQEDQKDRRREMGLRAAAGGRGRRCARRHFAQYRARAEWRGEQSNLLIF
jgi:hypothetical protein